MFLFLSKVLTGALTPLGMTLTFLAAGFVLHWRKRDKAAMRLFLCGALTLLIFSLPITSHLLMRGLEGRYPPRKVYESASAVVFLGGASIGKLPPRLHVETNYNADRFFHAVRVFRQTQSPKMALTGGASITFMGVDTVPEAHSMFELLNEFFGIDSSDVIIESKSRNTRENAVYTKKALEQAGLGTDIILVTSAYHMPRSVGIFKKAGFEKVIPAPTDYWEDERIPMALFRSWMPKPESLFNSSVAIKEYYGLLAYKIMGQI